MARFETKQVLVAPGFRGGINGTLNPLPTVSAMGQPCSVAEGDVHLSAAGDGWIARMLWQAEILPGV